MNTHKGIVNRLLWMQEAFQIDENDTLVQKTPYSFDVSVWEFFWPFMCGACLVVAKPEGHKDAEYLLNLIKRENITVIHFVPSMLRLFLEYADSERCTSLRHVILSGEALTIDLQNQYFNILKTPLQNLYGPTEAAVDVSYWKCDPSTQLMTVPIGRPIANTQLYILDDCLQPVPVGESGELHIGGVQVARGYLNRSKLTEEKFIQDPFSSDPTARIYKTGDLCRYLPDGNIEYLGRIDFQVKIRGNRIELGEISAAILKEHTIKDCVVLMREDTPGDQRLVAYVVKKRDDFSLEALRKRLAEELPDYMMPSAFVFMTALPLTPSGKTDSLSLPAPGTERPEFAHEYIAPRGETERIISEIWQEILRLDAVGLDDNFFDLGGHSLLMARMANRFQETFKRDISVLDLFQNPTVREQAKFLSIKDNQDRTKRDSKNQSMFAAESSAKNTSSDRFVGKSSLYSENSTDGIAVVGMACRFPGAVDVNQFWKNLRLGIESIHRFTEKELDDMGVPKEIYSDPNFVKAAAILHNTDRFDAEFFGYSPKEAEIINPQHRIFLECASNALEHAGYDPGAYEGKIGVFGGAGTNDYGGGYRMKSGTKRVVEAYQWNLGNELDYLTTRVGYKLGLKGPCMSVQTACSTSLVATHIACQNLLTHQCDMALAGGVTVYTHLKGGYFFQEGMILSPDGHCRAFDSLGQGTVPGEGVGIVVLKRVSDALADNDYILCGNPRKCGK